MRKIPICSVTELKNILTRFYGTSFDDIGIIGIRDRLFSEYETCTIIDRNEVERLKYSRNRDYEMFYDMIDECITLNALPIQFVLYVD